MSETFAKLAPLHWQALVAEAIRRRKYEKLTQREHAALAGVSIPTIVAFDRGETTLTLSKAFDILRVVGLVEETVDGGTQGTFVQEAHARWRALTSTLPEDSPIRFPNGWYRIDYALKGNLRRVGLSELETILDKAELPHTGWPAFLVPRRGFDTQVKEVNGCLECWYGDQANVVNRMGPDAAHSDYWCAAPAGRMVLIRGYQEDSQETFKPRTLFDPVLVIWRLGEALLHAARMSKLLAADQLLSSEEPGIQVHFRALYTGLSGRILRAWSNPMSELLIEGGAARSDEAMLEAIVPADKIEKTLAGLLTPMLFSLYERFGVTGLPMSRVEHEVERLRNSQVRTDKMPR